LPQPTHFPLLSQASPVPQAVPVGLGSEPQTPSEQVGLWQGSVAAGQSASLPHAPQTPLPHVLLVQSLAVRHFFPSAQVGQGPPQSTSVSVPFFTLSVHVGNPASGARIASLEQAD